MIKYHSDDYKVNIKMFKTFKISRVFQISSAHRPQVRISLGLVMKEIFYNSHQLNNLFLVWNLNHHSATVEKAHLTLLLTFGMNFS